MADAVVWLAVLVLVVAAMRSLRNRRTHVGPAGAGTIYDWLNEDKRKAIEIVVEGEAERQDGEYAEGNLPDLEEPRAGESGVSQDHTERNSPQRNGENGGEVR